MLKRETAATLLHTAVPMNPNEHFQVNTESGLHKPRVFFEGGAFSNAGEARDCR